MSQGRFTKEECKATEEAMEEIMKAFPRKKALDFVGHFNDVMLFLAAALQAAPSEHPAAILDEGKVNDPNEK